MHLTFSHTDPLLYFTKWMVAPEWMVEKKHKQENICCLHSVYLLFYLIISASVLSFTMNEWINKRVYKFNGTHTLKVVVSKPCRYISAINPQIVQKQESMEYNAEAISSGSTDLCPSERIPVKTKSEKNFFHQNEIPSERNTDPNPNPNLNLSPWKRKANSRINGFKNKKFIYPQNMDSC